MEDKILNPHTNKFVKIGSPPYKKLIKEGYRLSDLVDYTNDPKPIFIHSSSSEEDDEFENLRRKFFKNPTVDPRNPEKRIYKNKKPFFKLVEEFGDPYKPKNVKKTKKKNDNISGEDILGEKPIDNKITIITMTLPYLSHEDIFALYVSNKDLQNEINTYFLKHKGKNFIKYIRDFLHERHVYMEELEKERVRKNEEIKRAYVLQQQLKEQLKEQERQEELLREKEQEAIRREQEAIKRDEELTQQRYQQQEEIRKRYYAQFNNGILKQLNINSKAEWRKWVIANHPDKGVNNQYYGLVMEEGRRMGY